MRKEKAMSGARYQGHNQVAHLVIKTREFVFRKEETEAAAGCCWNCNSGGWVDIT